MTNHVHPMSISSTILAIHDGGQGKISLQRGVTDEYFVTYEQLLRGDSSAEKYIQAPDFAFSAARFHGNKRCRSNLIGLSCVAVSLKPLPAGRVPHLWQRTTNPESVVDAVLACIAQAGISAKPTLVAHEGGLHVTFAHTHLPADAETRWLAVQKRVIRLLMPYGAVAENVGITQMIPAGKLLLLGERADFEDLFRVLKLSREQCKRVREECRIRKNAEGGRVAKLWSWRLADIRAWIKLIWPDGVPTKYRQRMLWITTNALA